MPSVFSQQKILDILALIRNIWTGQRPAEMSADKLTLRTITVVRRLRFSQSVQVDQPSTSMRLEKIKNYDVWII
ncbi:TPA: hypothetical protein ACQQHT_006262 [Pseudomonas aeruginosa]|nr:hypothetical protein [Pseudomonas aeruginosa]